MTNFVDLSMWNVGFPTNIHWLYLKASEGAHWRDPTFQARRRTAWTRHIDVGAYHFADLTDPVAECQWFLNTIGVPAPGRLRPCLDLERGTVVTDKAWADAWVLHFKAERGYLPALYGSTSLVAPLRAASATLRACPLWEANYGPNDGSPHPLPLATGAVAHQYTSRGHALGVSGYVDCDLLLHPTAIMVPHPPITHLSPISKRAWTWARWWLGIGEYRGHGHYAYEHHVPHSAPPSTKGTLAVNRWRGVVWYIRNVLKK